MICSANTTVSLPFTVGGTGLIPGIALAPTVLPEAGRVEELFEQASNAFGFTLNQTHSYKEIEDRLLTNLLACDSNPRYQKASLRLPSERGCCNGESDETIEEVRNLLSHSCRLRPTAGCEEKKWSSKGTFTKSLALGMEDLARIAERFEFVDDPKTKEEILAIGRELLDLQRKYADSHYLFTHGMSRVHALLPKLITKLDHRLWPKRDSKDFIFARVVPPAKPMTQLSEIFQELKRKNDHALRYELLCADADLLNRDGSESALYYYLENTNIFREIHLIVCDILTRFAEEFGMDFSTTKCKGDFGSRVIMDTSTWHLFWRRGEYGALLAYAVPKTLIRDPNTNFVYTSIPFGKPVDEVDPLARLQELVSGSDRNTGLSVRLLTSHLRPENGIKAFWVGEKKVQNEHEQKFTDKFTEIAESFFNKILQHCHAQSAPGFLGFFGTKINPECERLLRETAAVTDKVGAL